MFEEFRGLHADALTRTTRIETLLQQLIKVHQEQKNDSDHLRNELKDAHGRYILSVVRTYVRPEPVTNLRKAYPLAITTLVSGLVLFLSSSFLLPISFKVKIPTGLIFIGLGMAFAGSLLLMACNQLRRLGITYALPPHRELLLEADSIGNVFVTRLQAVCPFCAREMRYRFLGDWRRQVYPKMVCTRNPYDHSMDFDHTTLSEPCSGAG